MHPITTSPRRLAPPTSIIVAIAAVAWLGVVVMVRHMGAMPGTMGLGLGAFTGVWALMMTAMMLPSIAPFASLYARGVESPRPLRLATLASGYLLVWTAAALPAFALARIADEAVAGNRGLATALAVAVFASCGAYQLTPLKERCLGRCRAPLGLVVRYAAHRGRTRDLRAGARHGAYCLGCCWGLMALLVAFGLMNVTAMVVLAVVVVAEKSWTQGPMLSRAVGAAVLVLAVAAVWMPGLAPGLESAHTMGGM